LRTNSILTVYHKVIIKTINKLYINLKNIVILTVTVNVKLIYVCT